MPGIDTALELAKLLESRNLDGLQILLADGFAAKGPSMALDKGQTIGFLRVLFTAFPDHSFGFSDLKEEAGAIRCTALESGTHTGVLDLTPFGMPISLPPTGRRVKLPPSKFTFRVEGDRVTEFAEETAEGGGLAGILAQLGVKTS